MSDTDFAKNTIRHARKNQRGKRATGEQRCAGGSSVTEATVVLGSARAVLLDFDGPVTPLMPAPANAHAADAGRAALAVHGIDASEIRATSDHLAVIRWAGAHAPEALPDVEAACHASEVEAARSCAPTPGAHELLRVLDTNGIPVVIVTNNAADAARIYLERWGLTRYLRDVVGRPDRRPDLMKPHPHIIDLALQITATEPAATVLIGDSVSDIEVARAVGVRSIGYAKNPRRGAELREARADATTDSMSNLVALAH